MGKQLKTAGVVATITCIRFDTCYAIDVKPMQCFPVTIRTIEDVDADATTHTKSVWCRNARDMSCSVLLSTLAILCASSDLKNSSSRLW